MHKPWAQSPVPNKLDMMAHACEASTQEIEAGESEIQDLFTAISHQTCPVPSEVQDHPQLHSELETSLGCMRSYLKRTIKC